MTKHRLLACLLVLCLLLGSVPAGLAEGGSGSSSDLVQLIREKLNRNNTAEETAPEAPAADAAPGSAGIYQAADGPQRPPERAGRDGCGRRPRRFISMAVQ